MNFMMPRVVSGISSLKLFIIKQREPEEMAAPRQMRVIAIPAPHNMPPPQDNMGPFQPPPPPQPQDQNEVRSNNLH